MEHFEDDDDNDNDSDDVENVVCVHGSWVTRRYARRQQYNRRDCLNTRSRTRNGQSFAKYAPSASTDEVNYIIDNEK